MQEQVYFFVDFEGSLGIERIKKCLNLPLMLTRKILDVKQ